MNIPGNVRSPLILLLAFAVVVSGCSGSAEDEQQVEREWPVKVATVSTNDTIDQRQFAGRVKAVQTVDLSFQVGGKLNYLQFREGEIIPKGKLIAALDESDFVREVKQARVNLDLLQKTLARQRSLAERNVISQQQLDETETNYDLAKVALEKAEQNLSYTKLKAPFDALVTRQLVENYTNVQAGQGIVRLQDVSEVRIQVSVPENLLATVNRERVNSVSATFEFLPGREFPLEYREHQAEADSVTQTYIVELGMPQPENVQILPGMTARVNLKLNQAQDDLWVPLSAVQSSADGSPYIWRINEDQSVSKTPVQLGRTDGEVVEIKSGVDTSMKLVAAGGQHLYEGAKVRNYAQ
ncbi:efflux RND transporter periplasmic adaptor subunit [Microbulbifer thermotolerans]|uniref:Efflux RND transporter periplasmic adaptor subunit n=1 Tax=Microbulbifer thermotolerans TaxID=252514 RepID=A0AB35HZ41_MICTH|nr:efflux RND transporter periplasmic adaptor subunit [Microbulbifer thermotolerans]MCX2779985.1 efflux RND transporter periplasmic adaptor subunit [Microbulbifer thermotolerans]MCX2781818.1 efflux RND transporter periplasmic adaptor subunit [Microbulbifer thermotolerans]MCX2795159.1 efflux RND transporter periplasmic adaptor subunit [Microbulbifer thermotolerans]MCX2801812.1 efflux RND transporter periplasmic adaptor subunit [Microbulbifer thermotolerans]MCX2805408.1 efflux RND transporter pe